MTSIRPVSGTQCPFVCLYAEQQTNDACLINQECHNWWIILPYTVALIKSLTEKMPQKANCHCIAADLTVRGKLNGCTYMGRQKNACWGLWKLALCCCPLNPRGFPKFPLSCGGGEGIASESTRYKCRSTGIHIPDTQGIPDTLHCTPV